MGLIYQVSLCLLLSGSKIFRARRGGGNGGFVSERHDKWGLSYNIRKVERLENDLSLA